MKLHKIAGISKKICCKEQLFAYRLVLNSREGMCKKLIELSDADFRNLINCQSELIYNTKIKANSCKLNVEAVYIAMLHGFYDYIKNCFGVLSYEQIGIIFYI